MTNQTQLTQNTGTYTAPKSHEFRRIIRVMFNRRIVIFGAVVVFIFLFLAAFGPLIAPYNPLTQDLSNVLQSPSAQHWLGTDQLGRDMFSRLIYGDRISFMVGMVAVTISCVVGMLLGLLAGYFGRWADNIIMRIIDALLALPPIALMLAIAAVLGGGLLNVMVSVGIGMIPAYARLTYGQVRTIRESDYITAANVSGASNMRIMFNHILPNAFPPLLILITLNMGTAILMEASLSFIGIGITLPTPAWGSMIYDGYKYLLLDPMMSFAPGIAITLVVLSFNIVGDGLRDALDPRLRGTL
jgi:peptide/nickel transport system permease protein